MVFLKNALMFIYIKVKLINQDCLPNLRLLYIMLYIMLACLMLLAALYNAVCLYNASFFSIYFCKCYLFSCFVLVYCHVVCLFHVLTCTMHSAFNLLIFPNSMLTSLLLFFLLKGICALRRNST